MYRHASPGDCCLLVPGTDQNTTVDKYLNLNLDLYLQSYFDPHYLGARKEALICGRPDPSGLQCAQDKIKVGPQIVFKDIFTSTDGVAFIRHLCCDRSGLQCNQHTSKPGH